MIPRKTYRTGVLNSRHRTRSHLRVLRSAFNIRNSRTNQSRCWRRSFVPNTAVVKNSPSVSTGFLSGTSLCAFSLCVIGGLRAPRTIQCVANAAVNAVPKPMPRVLINRAANCAFRRPTPDEHGWRIPRPRRVCLTYGGDPHSFGVPF